MSKGKVLLGMSGGVDSSVAAIVLKEQGYEVIGVTMQLFEGGCCNLDSSLDAKNVCKFLGIPHFIIDFRESFQKYVINDFICQYKNQRTPNPCIECNKYLKFGAMYEKAKQLGCNFIATGHYAKIEYDKTYGQNVLKISNAGKKDQSYVLYNLPKNMLDKVLFPLGEFHDKAEIREIAAKYHLPVAQKPDSEDICFIPDGNYKNFLEKHSDIKSKEGNIVLKDGTILGKHKGLYHYTIGQRKGLGIAYKVPLFVIGFNQEKNEVIVGEEKELYTKEFWVDDINLLTMEKIEKPLQVEIKIRYSAKTAPGTIMQYDNKIKVTFDEPQRAITPGQSAVFYKDLVVLGGGIIS